MSSHDIRKYLFDISEACERLVLFSSGKTLEDYRTDALLRSAIERQFEIVGEALNQAIKIRPELAHQVSDSGRIVSFRNRLIHGYSTVSNEIVWGVLETYLPRLRVEIRRLLESVS